MEFVSGISAELLRDVSDPVSAAFDFSSDRRDKNVPDTGPSFPFVLFAGDLAFSVDPVSAVSSGAVPQSVFPDERVCCFEFDRVSESVFAGRSRGVEKTSAPVFRDLASSASAPGSEPCRAGVRRTSQR